MQTGQRKQARKRLLITKAQMLGYVIAPVKGAQYTKMRYTLQLPGGAFVYSEAGVWKSWPFMWTAAAYALQLCGLDPDKMLRHD